MMRRVNTSDAADWSDVRGWLLEVGGKLLSIDRMASTREREELRMKRTISAMEARQHFGEVLEGVRYRGDEVVIERAGKPMAVVIPTERYEALEQARDRMFELMEKN